MHVSGTTGFDYATMTLADGVLEQAEQCLRNIGSALAEAGCTFTDVVRVRYLIPNREDCERCWPILRRHFADVRPAATMFVAGLADPRMKTRLKRKRGDRSRKRRRRWERTNQTRSHVTRRWEAEEAGGEDSDLLSVRVSPHCGRAGRA